MKFSPKIPLFALLSTASLACSSQSQPQNNLPKDTTAQHKKAMSNEQYIGNIGMMNETDAGIELGLITSARVFSLPKNSPDYDRLKKLLNDAVVNRKEVALTLNGDHITDVKIQP